MGVADSNDPSPWLISAHLRVAICCYLGIMSKQISKSVGGSSPAWLEQPTATKSEFASMSQNQSLSQFTPHGVYTTPPPSLLQSPAQQVSYGPQPLSAAGGSCVSSPMVQTTRPSPTMPAGYLKRKAAGGSENQRGCQTNKICNLTFMPYPPKEDADSTLSDVIDYIMLTEGEIQQLEEKLSWVYSILLIKRFIYFKVFCWF